MHSGTTALMTGRLKCSNLLLGFGLFLLIATSAGGARAYGQQPAPDPYPPLELSTELQALRDSLFDINQDIQLLQHFLEAATVDPRALRSSSLRSWQINNPALRDSLFSAFMQVDSSVQGEAGAEAIVLATPDDDLVQVRFGNAVLKGIALKEAIERSADRNLYRKVAASYRYSRDIELRDPAVRIPTAFQPRFMGTDEVTTSFSPGPVEAGRVPYANAVELSLTGLSAQIGKHWGGEISMGFDEANLPFWTSGTFKILAWYDRVKFGAALPLLGGRNGSTLPPPFALRSRVLNGAPGIVASADFGPLGGSLAFLQMTGNSTSSLTNPADFYYLSGYITLYTSFGITLGRDSYARAKFGAGMRRIGEAQVTSAVAGSPDAFSSIGQETAFSPYLSFEFLKQGDDERIKAGVQFFDLTVSFFGSLEVVPDLLSIEARYLWPVAPALRPWENPDFLLITPRLRVPF